ncbi:MAG: prepilin peptidase [Deltaproteobacteria bacterium]|nr:prepilin peptidase [Deltaproteobacteria bacterium]
MGEATAAAALELAREVLLFVFGACIGSFLNVCITRLPRGESILFPASHCRSCNTRLPLRAMVPLASYLLLRARCIHCSAPISPRYFLVELCSGALTLACYRRFGPGPPFIARLSFAGALLTAAVIDFETGIIPDVISVYGTAWAFVLSWCAPAFSIQPWPSPLNSLLGALFGAGVLLATARGYRAVTGREGLGGGDVKLLAMIGSFVGWEGVPGILFLSALSGTLCGIALMVLRRDVSLTTPLPFAPFLCLGALLHTS